MTNGEYVCTKCGLVIERQLVDPIFQMHETNETRRTRNYVALGHRPAIVGGMGSYIDYQTSRFFHDRSGKPLPPMQQRLFRRLKFDYNLRLRIEKRETAYRALKALSRIADILSLSSNMKDRAAYYYQKMDRQLGEEDIISHLTLMAYSLMLAIRESRENAPITLQEIVKAFQRLGHRVTARSVIRQALMVKDKMPIMPVRRRSEDYLRRIVSQVINYPRITLRIRKAGMTTQRYQTLLLHYAKLLFSMIDDAKRGGRNPFIFAVAVVYGADLIIAKKAKRRAILTQRLVSDATGAAEYSVRDHYAKILKKKLFSILAKGDFHKPNGNYNKNEEREC